MDGIMLSQNEILAQNIKYWSWTKKTHIFDIGETILYKDNGLSILTDSKEVDVLILKTGQPLVTKSLNIFLDGMGF